MSEAHPNQWWGPVPLAVNQAAVRQIAMLKLAVSRLPAEWRLCCDQQDLLEEDDLPLSAAVVEAHEAPEYPQIQRYVFRDAGSPLSLLPALADRPVVIQPFQPFTVPAGEEGAIFVSTPLWVHLGVGEPAQTLAYLPIRRPTDTWFGPNTMEGELCYASRTFGRMGLSEIPLRPHRAVTRVNIHNRAASPLLVERLSLPVPYLSRYAGDDARLWTESVAMERDRDGGHANFRIEKNAPAEAPGALLVAGPRQAAGESLSFRAFGALLRGGIWS